MLHTKMADIVECAEIETYRWAFASLTLSLERHLNTGDHCALGGVLSILDCLLPVGGVERPLRAAARMLQRRPDGLSVGHITRIADMNARYSSPGLTELWDLCCKIGLEQDVLLPQIWGAIQGTSQPWQLLNPALMVCVDVRRDVVFRHGNAVLSAIESLFENLLRSNLNGPLLVSHLLVLLIIS